MATSLISDTQKTKIQEIIDDIHETFARTITIFEEGERVLISASSTYNGIYGRTDTGSKSTTKTTVSHSVKARIKYGEIVDENLIDGNIDSQLGIDYIKGQVRITVDVNGYNILKEAKRVEFEGRKYTINSKGSPTGMFGPRYYHFYLRPIEE